MGKNSHAVVPMAKNKAAVSAYNSTNYWSSSQQAAGYVKTQAGTMVAKGKYVNTRGDKYEVTKVCKVVQQVKVVKVGYNSNVKQVKQQYHGTCSSSVYHH